MLKYFLTKNPKQTKQQRNKIELINYENWSIMPRCFHLKEGVFLFRQHVIGRAHSWSTVSTIKIDTIWPTVSLCNYLSQRVICLWQLSVLNILWKNLFLWCKRSNKHMNKGKRKYLFCCFTIGLRKRLPAWWPPTGVQLD